MKMGEKYSIQSIREKAVNYVLENFVQVMHTIEFRQLPQGVVSFFLDHDLLQTQREEIQVFRAARAWIEEDDSRIGFMFNIMKCVRFPLIPKDLITDEVLRWHCVFKEKACAALITEALCFHGEAYGQPLMTGKQFTIRGMPGLAVFYPGVKEEGFRVKRAGTDVQMFTCKHAFTTKPCGVSFAYQSLTCVTSGNYVFVLGTDNTYFGPVSMRYDANNDEWAQLQTPDVSGVIGATAVLCGKHIYLMGGILVDKTSEYKLDNDLNLKMLRYSIKENKWSAVTHSRFAQDAESDCFQGAFGASTVASSSALSESSIYLAGGYKPECGSISDLRIYTPATNTWKLDSDMHFNRANLVLEACPNTLRLFAVGGLALKQNGSVQRPVSVVEAFDCNTGQWTLLNTMISISGATSHYKDGVMYVIGGYRGYKNDTEPTNGVVKFDTTRDALVMGKNAFPSVCPLPCMHHGSALLTVPMSAN